MFLFHILAEVSGFPGPPPPNECTRKVAKIIKPYEMDSLRTKTPSIFPQKKRQAWPTGWQIRWHKDVKVVKKDVKRVVKKPAQVCERNNFRKTHWHYISCWNLAYRGIFVLRFHPAWRRLLECENAKVQRCDKCENKCENVSMPKMRNM